MLDSTHPQRHVFIVDDDVQTLRAFARILHVEGFEVDTFHSASEFLKHPPSDVPSCLVLDLKLPEIDGLQLQQLMRNARVDIPIIFISGYGDVPSTASAMRFGAVDFSRSRSRGHACWMPSPMRLRWTRCAATAAATATMRKSCWRS